MKPSPSDAWPKLPPLPNAAVRLKDFLETINRKGVATRSDLLRLPLSEAALNWTVGWSIRLTNSSSWRRFPAKDANAIVRREADVKWNRS